MSYRSLRHLWLIQLYFKRMGERCSREQSKQIYDRWAVNVSRIIQHFSEIDMTTTGADMKAATALITTQRQTIADRDSTIADLTSQLATANAKALDADDEAEKTKLEAAIAAENASA